MYELPPGSTIVHGAKDVCENFDFDLQEFEALTVEEACKKLLVHFSNMGFRLLPWSDKNLMVICPFEIGCA